MCHSPYTGFTAALVYHIQDYIFTCTLVQIYIQYTRNSPCIIPFRV